MADYPYINTTGKLREFVEKISTMGVPDSATTKWLPKVGFGSTNHRPIIKILNFIGFLDGSSPTQRWISFRDNSQSAYVMAEGLRSGYSDLFSTYEDAHERSDEELKNFFKGKMKGADQVIGNTVNTFKTLCSFADFNVLSSNGTDTIENGNTLSANETPPLVSPPQTVESPLPTLHIDLQVHIAADAPTEQIDKIFESMAKHLYGKIAE